MRWRLKYLMFVGRKYLNPRKIKAALSAQVESAKEAAKEKIKEKVDEFQKSTPKEDMVTPIKEKVTNTLDAYATFRMLFHMLISLQIQMDCLHPLQQGSFPSSPPIFACGWCPRGSCGGEASSSFQPSLRCCWGSQPSETTLLRRAPWHKLEGFVRGQVRRHGLGVWEQHERPGCCSSARSIPGTYLFVLSKLLTSLCRLQAWIILNSPPSLLYYHLSSQTTTKPWIALNP